MNTTAIDAGQYRLLRSLNAFISPRGGSNSWAQREDLITAFRKGDLFQVPPLTLEYAPILHCNAACPYCPYTQTRHKSLGRAIAPLGQQSVEDDLHASMWSTALHIIDSARFAGVRGILFTGGGEPTIWPSLFQALHYCNRVGIQTAIYTNGFELARQSDLACQLLHPDTGLVFGRISINTASSKSTRLHWGVHFPVFELQLEGLAQLLRARENLLTLYTNGRVPSIQISTIVDKHTVCDLEEIIDSVEKHLRRVVRDAVRQGYAVGVRISAAKTSNNHWPTRQ